MDSVNDDRGLLCQVSPFRNLRILGYLHLPVAYRSLSRLSSALSAKASTLRSYSVDHGYDCIALQSWSLVIVSITCYLAILTFVNTSVTLRYTCNLKLLGCLII